MKMRMTQVSSIDDISPHMRRIVLQGEDLSDFPLGKEGAHFKAIFPQPGQVKPKLGFHLSFKKWMRSYTVRAFDAQNKELTVDFAVNKHEGLATNWAQSAKIGDYLGVGGVGSTKHKNYQADWHLLFADLTGLPATAAILEKLPLDALGYAFIQVPSEEDKQEIDMPEGINITWIINNNLHKNELLAQGETLKWPKGSPSIFIAAERNQMKTLRQYVKHKPGYLHKQTYASAYWKA